MVFIWSSVIGGRPFAAGFVGNGFGDYRRFEIERIVEGVGAASLRAHGFIYEAGHEAAEIFLASVGFGQFLGPLMDGGAEADGQLDGAGFSFHTYHILAMLPGSAKKSRG